MKTGTIKHEFNVGDRVIYSGNDYVSSSSLYHILHNTNAIILELDYYKGTYKRVHDNYVFETEEEAIELTNKLNKQLMGYTK